MSSPNFIFFEAGLFHHRIVSAPGEPAERNPIAFEPTAAFNPEGLLYLIRLGI